MKMKTTPLLAPILFTIFLWGAGESLFASDSPTRPHIVFLLADDQNTLSVGCYGNAEVRTPEMDRLGQDGLIFDRHYNTTAICMASRASIFTGMYEYKTGTNFDHGDMRPEVWEKSYPVLLREAGYFTAFAGKFGMEVTGRGLCADDFDRWGGGPGQTHYETARNESMAHYAENYPHSTLSYGAFGRDAIRQAVKEGKPLCLSISFKAPHRPVQPDPKFDHIYAGATFTKPVNYGLENGAHLSPQSKQGRQYERFESWGYDRHYDEVMRLYYQQVFAIDVALGMIREELEAQGIADETVIIYTSDNGFICGSHGYGSKVLPMEESSRAPLIIYDPRISPDRRGRRTSGLTGNIDFAPTILELAGLPVPGNMDGKSLIPLCRDPLGSGHEELALINTYGAIPTTSLSIVAGDFKYTYWWYGDDSMEPTEELFNLALDPHEMGNLANHPDSYESLNRMRQLYDRAHSTWEAEGVEYNRYPHHWKTFDRNLPLSEKVPERSNDGHPSLELR